MARTKRQKVQQPLPHIPAKPPSQATAGTAGTAVTLDKQTQAVVTAALSKYRASIARAKDRERNDAYGAELRERQLADIDEAMTKLGVRLI